MSWQGLWQTKPLLTTHERTATNGESCRRTLWCQSTRSGSRAVLTTRPRYLLSTHCCSDYAEDQEDYLIICDAANDLPDEEDGEGHDVDELPAVQFADCAPEDRNDALEENEE